MHDTQQQDVPLSGKSFSMPWMYIWVGMCDVDKRINSLHCGDAFQVHISEERLESTIEELTRLEMAAHGFTAALSFSVGDSMPSASSEAAGQELAMAVSAPARQQSAASSSGSSTSSSSTGVEHRSRSSRLAIGEAAQQRHTSSLGTRERVAQQREHKEGKQALESFRSAALQLPCYVPLLICIWIHVKRNKARRAPHLTQPIGR